MSAAEKGASSLSSVVPADGRVTTTDAAARLGVPASRIRDWKRAGRLVPCGMVPGRGPTKMQPLYYLVELQPLAESYHARAARRADRTS